jgi:hypothetical protein
MWDLKERKKEEGMTLEKETHVGLSTEEIGQFNKYQLLGLGNFAKHIFFLAFR